MREIITPRMHELLDIIYAWETEYLKEHTFSSADQRIEALYENAPQEVIDAHKELMSYSPGKYYMP